MSDELNNTGDLNTGDLNTGNLNTGDLNTGNRNTGDWNTGDWNTGDWNTGDWNTGNRNTGDWNTGNRNTGDLNTGNRNTGDWNTGDRNTGYLNTGNRNTGDWNTGNLNTGDLNTGDWNTGNRNTGDWNTGNRNTGYLNTGDGVVTLFDKPCPGLSWDDAAKLVPWVDLPVGVEWVPTDKMTGAEKDKYPKHATIGGYLKELNVSVQESFPLVWAKESVEWKRRWLALPHFNADKFVTLVGVDVRKDRDLYPAESASKPSAAVESGRTIVLDGVTYRLVPVELETGGGN